MIRDPLGKRFTEVNGGVHVHVRISTPLSVSRGNGWTDGAENWCVVRGPPAMHFKQDGDILPSARVTVHTFKHIYSLTLVHRRKRRLTGIFFLTNYNGWGVL